MQQLWQLSNILMGLVSLISYGQTQISATTCKATGDFSAYSVSLSDDRTTMAIGAHYDVGNGSESGHVRVYKNNAGVWSQVGADINGETVDDWSGYSVSLSNDGTTVAIGATHNSANGTNSGHVRVYKNNAGTWSQVGADINGEARGDWSGYSVSLSNDGTTVAIGAIFNSGSYRNSGHVRVYKNVSGNWIQIGADINGKAARDYCGASVSLSSDGTVLAIGAHQGGGAPGIVRVYKNVSGDWIQIGNDIDGDTAGNFSGWSVGLSNDASIVAIGAYLNNDDGIRKGYVRVYENNSGNWTRVGFDIDGKATGDDLSGHTISISGDGAVMIIGAYEKDSENKEQRLLGVAHVYVYENNSGDWTPVSADIYKAWSNSL